MYRSIHSLSSVKKVIGLEGLFLRAEGTILKQKAHFPKIRKLKNAALEYRNVSQVQLPVDSLHGAAWVLRLFELV